MKILLLFLACLIFIPVIFIKKYGNKFYFISILICIAANMYYETHFKNEIVHIPILSIFLLITIPFLLFRNKIIVIKYRKIQLSILFLILSMIFLLITQFFYINIYDFRLYFRTFFSYLNILLLFIVFQIIGSKLTVDFYLKIIACFSLFNSILGILQYIFNKKFLIGAFNENIDYYEGLVIVKRAVGFIGANNGAGNLGAILFPFLIYFCLRSKTFFSYFILILNVVFTFITFTRAGLLSIAIVGSIFLLIYLLKTTLKSNILKKILLVCFLICIGVLFTALFYDAFYRVFFEYRGNTEEYRLYQYDYTKKLLNINLLLGIGAGNFDHVVGYIFGVYGIGILHSHFLNILVEQGLISFVIFLIYNYFLFKLIKKEYWNLSPYIPYLIFIAYIIPINFNANQYYELNIYVFYFGVLALITAYKGKYLNVN